MGKLSGQALDEKLKEDMERYKALQPLARKHKLHIPYCTEQMAQRIGHYLFTVRDTKTDSVVEDLRDVPVDSVAEYLDDLEKGIR